MEASPAIGQEWVQGLHGCVASVFCLILKFSILQVSRLQKNEIKYT